MLKMCLIDLATAIMVLENAYRGGSIRADLKSSQLETLSDHVRPWAAKIVADYLPKQNKLNRQDGIGLAAFWIWFPDLNEM